MWGGRSPPRNDCYRAARYLVIRCDEKADKNIDFSHDFRQIGSREAIDLAADASIHLLRVIFCVWLDRVVSSRNSIKTIDFL